MKIELLTQGGSQSGPISAGELQLSISEAATLLGSSDDAARQIASRLSTKSSQHKFLVSVTKIDQVQNTDADVSIRSVVGAVWDEQKDGYVSLRVDDDSVHLVTVYWIHVG